MPRISAFYGIVISMYWDEHPPPHFHATYAEWSAQIEVESLHVMGGDLPPRAQRLVRKWASEHRGELLANWRRLERGKPPRKIAPLP